MSTEIIRDEISTYRSAIFVARMGIRNLYCDVSDRSELYGHDDNLYPVELEMRQDLMKICDEYMNQEDQKLVSDAYTLLQFMHIKIILEKAESRTRCISYPLLQNSPRNINKMA